QPNKNTTTIYHIIYPYIYRAHNMVYKCPRCNRLFRSWRSYMAHILIGLEGGSQMRKRGSNKRYRR
ncbi:MAG: hypothetical protein QXO42_05755, partial [Ignisphaera sp.]